MAAIRGAPVYFLGLAVSIGVFHQFVLNGTGIPKVAAEMKMDPKTFISFPRSSSFKVGKDLSLVGVGTRSLAGVIKIYSAGFYVSPKIMKAPGKNTDDLMKDKGVKAIQLTFAMGVGADKVATALSGVPGVDQNVIDDFQQMLLKGMGKPFKKGESMTLEWTKKGNLQVTVRGALVGELSDVSLVSGLLKMYLGKKPVSPGLKADIISTLGYSS